MSTDKSQSAGFRKLPLSHSTADSQASALRLVLTLFPDWETADGKVEFIRFKEGITNTLLKAVKRRPGYSEEDIDKEAVLIRAYGKGTDVLIDRERAAFVVAEFIRGQVCDSGDLTEERIWRGVARRLAEWHALLPIVSTPITASDDETDYLLMPFEKQLSRSRPSAKAINSITPSKPTPNVWTVIQKWIFALPTSNEDESQRKGSLQKQLERTVADLGDMPSLGKDGLVFAHCDLLSGNVIVHPHDTESTPPIATISFIDYEYATPAPAAFDLANHFAEWGGFECNYNALPTRSVRRAFIEDYLRYYTSHIPLPSDVDEHTYVDRLFEEVDAYRGVPGLYWGIWALIQATISQIDFDYATYAEVRLQEYWDWRAEREGTGQQGKEKPLRERRWAEQ
ncbi:MAG: hypothetical protein Q9196_002235 [Gyalolechia fulgens]